MRSNVIDGPIFSRRNSYRFPLIIAHRGGNVLAPQNSLPAFETACAAGVWALESDLRFTSDGVPVCMHDADVAAMTDGEGAVRDLDFLTLSRLRIDTGVGADTLPAERLRIPTMDDYFDICMRFGTVPFIELKEDDGIEEVIRGLRERSMESYAVISSVKFERLARARELSEKVFIHHIFSSEERVSDLCELGYAGMSFKIADPSDIPEGLVARIHSAGLRLCLRAADTTEKMRRMIELGLDYQPSNCVFGL
ncbi:MAG: hypothetical protein ILO42_09705 [Clostridia bacterium]|nr:hypothetical protein [Clostridia bacterium]MBP5271217.1 hypothetical protein [Clostridia bacterium]